MSALVVLMCLIAAPECTEHNARAVWRAEMTTMECDTRIPELVRWVKDHDLNPTGGYYTLFCRALPPKA